MVSFRRAASTNWFWYFSPGSRAPISPRPTVPKSAQAMVSFTWGMEKNTSKPKQFHEKNGDPPGMLSQTKLFQTGFVFVTSPCVDWPKRNQDSRKAAIGCDTSPIKGSSCTFLESSIRIGRNARSVSTDWRKVAPIASTISAKSLVSSWTLWLAPSIRRKSGQWRM